MSDALSAVSFEAFVEAEQLCEDRHELVGGLVYEHAGGTKRHDLATHLLYEALAPGARAAGCTAFIHRMLHTPSGNTYYPDLMVTCSPSQSPLHEDNAALIIEVLSPSTRSIDRREKAIAYAQLASLQLYVLVYPDYSRFEVARPKDGAVGSWEALGPGQMLFTPFGDITLDALYGELDHSAAT